MSINNKVAVLLEDKLDFYIRECIPSNEITQQFMNVLNLFPDIKQLLIKMRYGLNEDEYKYKWNDILEKVNGISGAYEIRMYGLKRMEREIWHKIRRSLVLSDFDIQCNKLLKIIKKDPTSLPKDTACVGGYL